MCVEHMRNTHMQLLSIRQINKIPRHEANSTDYIYEYIITDTNTLFSRTLLVILNFLYHFVESISSNMSAVWVKVISSWLCFAIYMWTLVAPAILQV